MQSVKRFLAFDLGAESGRAIVGTLQEGRLSLREIYRFPTGGTRVCGHLFWNVLGFYTHILEGLKQYVFMHGSELDGIGVDTWGVDFGLLDSRGILLANPYHYRDNRNAGTEEIIREKIGDRRLYELTGIQLMSINTVNQLVSMVRDGDPALAAARNILFMGDLLHYFLTGKKMVEYTMATISQLFNPVTGEWEKEIFRALGIPMGLATDVIRAGDVIGPLVEEISQEVGLGPVAVIAPAVHDTAGAAVAVPTESEEGSAFLSSGTWSIVGLELNRPIINEKSFNLNISNSGGALNKTLYLKNVMGLWIIQGCKRIWNKKDPHLDYGQIANLAGRARPFAAFIDPDDPIFLNPDDPVGAITGYCRKTGQGEVDPGDAGALARIVFESLALKYRFVLERLIEATGREVDTLHITGGGSRNRLLTQFMANALGLPVTAGPMEATAIGNIMLQAVGAECCASLKEIRRVVRDSFGVEDYRPESTAAWDEAYRKFTEII